MSGVYYGGYLRQVYCHSELWSEPVIGKGVVRVVNQYGHEVLRLTAAAAEDLAASLERHAAQARTAFVQEVVGDEY